MLFVGVLTLAGSIGLLFSTNESRERIANSLVEMWYEFGIIIPGLLLIFGVALLVTIPMTVGEIARGEVSPLPWEAFSQSAMRHGTFDGVFAFVTSSITALWIFLVPGHLLADSIYKRDGKWPKYPYVINILVGLILSTPGNPVYRLLEWLLR